MIKPLLAAAALAVSLPVAALAETTDAPAVIGPVVGSTAPSLDGALKVKPDSAVWAEEASGSVIVFVRSAAWCPFCKTQLVDLKAAAEPLADAGWTLKALSYDSPEVLESFAAENELNYILLSDEDSSEIDAFGLRNADVRPGSRTDGIPHPAVVFVRESGSVAAVLREDGYKDRPQVDAILETVTYLNAADGA